MTVSRLLKDMRLHTWPDGDYLEGEPELEAHLKTLGLEYDGESICIGKDGRNYASRAYWCEDLQTFIHIAFQNLGYEPVLQSLGFISCPIFVEIFGNQY